MLTIPAVHAMEFPRLTPRGVSATGWYREDLSPLRTRGLFVACGRSMKDHRRGETPMSRSHASPQSVASVATTWKTLTLRFLRPTRRQRLGASDAGLRDLGHARADRRQRRTALSRTHRQLARLRSRAARRPTRGLVESIDWSRPRVRHRALLRRLRQCAGQLLWQHRTRRSAHPQDGQPYGPRFPWVRIPDMVRAQRHPAGTAGRPAACGGGWRLHRWPAGAWNGP